MMAGWIARRTPDHLPGVDVTVHRVVADGRTVSIEFEARNGSSRRITLAQLLPTIDDGHGSTFVSIEQGSDDLADRLVEFEPGDEATVTLSWRGVIAPAADSLTLTLNHGARGENSESTPYLQIEDLPVPGR